METTPNTNAPYAKLYLVGQIAKPHLTPEALERLSPKWRQEWTDIKELRKLGYLTSHINAMVHTPAHSCPSELRGVCRYKLSLSSEAIHHSSVAEGYNMRLLTACVWFFPLGITLLSIEVDESGNTLDKLTLGHRKMKQWPQFVQHSETLLSDSLLAPLAALSPQGNQLDKVFVSTGNLKMYQVVAIECGQPTDHLLYELGLSLPIGSSEDGGEEAPDPDYFHQLMTHNTVSDSANWKALAINDSYTLVYGGYQDKPTFSLELHAGSNFELIYMRCLFEHTFCYTRNDLFRSGKRRLNYQLPRELALMDRYYFYENFSHMFLPPLLYRAMACGLDLERERQELATQINALDAQRLNLITIVVGALALFSVAFDFYSLVINAFNDGDYSVPVALTALVVALMAVVGLSILVGRGRWSLNIRPLRKVNILCKGRVQLDKDNIRISQEARQHIDERHVSGRVSGSLFAQPFNLDTFLTKQLSTLLPINEQVADNGFVERTYHFDTPIGTTAVVDIKDLNDEERSTIHTAQRGTDTVREATSSRQFPTSYCTLILNPVAGKRHTYQLVTLHPGEPAPPDYNNPWWEQHVFVIYKP